jgi:NAD(P)H-nitrite reductase large subunit
VIATGARAVVPNIEGVNQKGGIFLVRNYGDGVKIYEAFKKSARTSEIDLTVVEMSDHVLPTLLDSSMAKIVERELEANGVKVITRERVEEIVGDGGTDGQVKGVMTNTKREIDTDFIVLGTGIKPNSEIARDAGVELGYANAIKVDGYMRTNLPDIFAAGDCATATSYVTNEDTYLLWEQQQTSRGELHVRTLLVEVQDLEELQVVL